MMYMTGGGIQVFSVMSVWFLLKQAVGGMLAVENGSCDLRCLPQLSFRTHVPLPCDSICAVHGSVEE